MAIKRFWLGMLVITLAFGMTLIGCGNGTTGDKTDPALNGTWQITSIIDGSGDLVDIDMSSFEYIEYKYNNGNYEVFMNNTPMSQTSYTTNGDQITLIPTRCHGNYFVMMDITLESKWYSKNELKAALLNEEKYIEYNENGEYEIEYIEYLENMEDTINQMFTPQTVKYTVSGNMLIFTMEIDGETITYTYTRKN